MPLKNAGSQIAFTSVVSNTYAAIIIGHVETGPVRKHYISPVSTPVQWQRSCAHCSLRRWSLWTMEADTMACEPLVQPSKDGDELLTQTGPNLLQYFNVDSTLWIKPVLQLSRFSADSGRFEFLKTGKHPWQPAAKNVADFLYLKLYNFIIHYNQ